MWLELFSNQKSISLSYDAVQLGRGVLQKHFIRIMLNTDVVMESLDRHQFDKQVVKLSLVQISLCSVMSYIPRYLFSSFTIQHNTQQRHKNSLAYFDSNYHRFQLVYNFVQQQKYFKLKFKRRYPLVFNLICNSTYYTDAVLIDIFSANREID